MKKKVDFMPRFMAAIVDGVIAWLPVFIPIIGGLLGAVYLLVKDGIIYEITRNDEWKNKSIGKKLFKLEVVRTDGKRVDITTSAKRNLPLTIGSFISIIPIMGWIIGPIIAFGLALVELVLFLIDKQGRRLGDRFAETQVVAVEIMQPVKKEIV